MMHIIYAVMAIALICLVTFGGVSYINPDAPTRAVASRGLVAQYEAIHSGITSYRSVNNGITPDSIELFKGFLPHGGVPSFGAADEGFRWTLRKVENEDLPVLCLEVSTQDEAKLGAALNFAREIERRTSADISMGASCGQGAHFEEAVAAVIPDQPVFTIRSF
jgi:hypothetical protein